MALFGIFREILKDICETPQQKLQREEAEKAALQAEKAAKAQELMDYLINVTDEEKNKSYLDYGNKEREFRWLATEEQKKQFEDRMKEKYRLKEEAEKNAVRTAIEQNLEKQAADTGCEYGKGKCFWYGRAFYCTCGDAECPKKKYINPNEHVWGEVIAEEHIPYIKLWGKFSGRYTTESRKPLFYDEDDEDGEDQIVGFTRVDLLRHFFDKFMPEGETELVPENNEYNFPMMNYCIRYGLGKNNAMLDILFDYYQKTGKRMPHVRVLTYLRDVLEIDLRQEFFKNPSLYDRNENDLLYAAVVLSTASNPDEVSKYFTNPDKVDVALLYNPDGSIKETGFGGPRNGHYGDVIYNLAGEWGAEIKCTMSDIRTHYTNAYLEYEDTSIYTRNQ